MRRRSRNPSFRGAGEYGADGTVGVGVHMGYQRPMLSSSFESSAGVPPPVAQPTRGSDWKRAESVMNAEANPLQGFEMRSGRVSRAAVGTISLVFAVGLVLSVVSAAGSPVTSSVPMGVAPGGYDWDAAVARDGAGNVYCLASHCCGV